ncbi:MAG: ABC transporter permease [Vicinamibacterales bacterium]|nr:ABC transporter permease [Vicinamibacterales bacterium]
MPAVMPTSSGGLATVVGRELGRMASTPFYLLGLVVFPIVSAWLIAAIFGHGVVRDLPVSIVDHDRSPLSGRLARMLDATPGLRLAHDDPDMAAAQTRVLRGESYGVIVVPRNFARDVTRGNAPRVSVFYNAQYLLPASTIRKEAMAAINTLSASIEAGRRTEGGRHPDSVAGLVEPVSVDVHTLGNPALSYVPYLVTGVLPSLFQIFVMVMAVHAFGSELKDGTAGAWFQAAGGRARVAIAGKLLPYAVYFSALGLAMLGGLFWWMGIPLQGNLPAVAGATVLFGLAYLAMGFAAVALTGNLRLATSLAAFYSVPAFAFAGLTFPTWGMPIAGQAWSSLLPLSHYLELVVDLALRGSPLHAAGHPLVALAAFATVPWLALGWRMAALARDPRAWGRQ